MHKFTIIFLLFLLAGSMVQAQDSARIEISKNADQELILFKSFDSESLAHNDRLQLISKNGEKNYIYSSEGRNIEKVLQPDLDGDGNKEILIQMDLGGSGGYKEFALLKSEEGIYKTFWESTGFSGAKTMLVADKSSGKARVSIKYFDDNYEPARPAIAVFGWYKNKFTRLR